MQHSPCSLGCIIGDATQGERQTQRIHKCAETKELGKQGTDTVDTETGDGYSETDRQEVDTLDADRPEIDTEDSDGRADRQTDRPTPHSHNGSVGVGGGVGSGERGSYGGQRLIK